MKIVVLYGGEGSEREVSLASGDAVASGLSEAGFDAVKEDITSISGFLKRWDSFNADGVFIALHGGWGEDGRLQAALESWSIPYTGSPPGASMFAMDKDVTRALFKEASIPVADGFTLRRGGKGHKEVLREALDKWGCVVLKPASNGSTVGVTITEDAIAAENGLAGIWDIDDKAVVEKYIHGAELTAAVFDGGDPVVFPPIEIKPVSGFYDYESKYTRGRTEYICPAALPEQAAQKISAYAAAAHSVLGCRVYSRVDFRMSEDGELFALEVNTLPGMTATSLVPKAALAYGWSMPELLRKIVEVSFKSGEIK